jgi:hypothetical protein
VREKESPWAKAEVIVGILALGATVVTCLLGDALLLRLSGSATNTPMSPTPTSCLPVLRIGGMAQVVLPENMLLGVFIDPKRAYVVINETTPTPDPNMTPNPYSLHSIYDPPIIAGARPIGYLENGAIVRILEGPVSNDDDSHIFFRAHSDQIVGWVVKDCLVPLQPTPRKE